MLKQWVLQDSLTIELFMHFLGLHPLQLSVEQMDTKRLYEKLEEMIFLLFLPKKR